MAIATVNPATEQTLRAVHRGRRRPSLHEAGVLSDLEFAAAKAQALDL